VSKHQSLKEAIQRVDPSPPPEPKGVIRLQFCGPADWFGRLIAWFGWGYHGFCHVLAILSSGEFLDAQWSAVGGAPAGVQIRQANYGKWAYVKVVEFEVTADQAARWEAYLRSKVGTPYDREDILDYGLGWKPAGQGLICSWLQANGLASVEIIRNLGELFAQFSPNTLYAVVRSIGGVVVERP
jgi:hypothetical protein